MQRICLFQTRSLPSILLLFTTLALGATDLSAQNRDGRTLEGSEEHIYKTVDGLAIDVSWGGDQEITDVGGIIGAAPVGDILTLVRK